MPEIILPADSQLYTTFQNIIKNKKIVLFAGLPGVGKSLYLQQLSLMAEQANRNVHLLQWDVTRTAFETPETLAQYPEIDGVTHAGIRKAVGLWARQGIKKWHNEHQNTTDMLIGEVPLIGNRLIELVQQKNDDTEDIFTNQEALFVLPVPSKRIRNIIEKARANSISKPQNDREINDAPPNVLELLWQDLHKLAVQLKLTNSTETSDYDPMIYAGVYEQLMKHRKQITLHVDENLKPNGSVYDLNNIKSELAANPQEVKEILEFIDKEFSQDELERSVADWFKV